MHARGCTSIVYAAILVLVACTPTGTTPSAAPTGSPTPMAFGQLASGWLALYVTLSPGKTTSSVVVESGDRILLDSTDYRVIRFTQDPPRAVLVDWTRSASFGKSYIYPLTESGRLFIVHARGDGYPKDLQELDPRTNAPLQRCSFESYSTTKGFAVVGDRVYFRTRVVRDLLGRVTGGGELVYHRFPCLGQPTRLLAGNDPSNYGEPLSAGGALFAVTHRDETIEIRLLDRETGATRGTADLIRSKVHEARLYEGDDAIYFGDKRGDELDVVRISPDGRAEAIATIELGADTVEGLTIDADGGDVYVVLADPTPRFFLIGTQPRGIRQLSLDAGLYSTLIHGGGQILRTR